MQRNFKPFWKSKTIIISAILLVGLILDYAFSWGIEPILREGINSVFTENQAGEITGFNWTAFLGLVFAIAMRFVSTNSVTTSQKGADNKELKFIRSHTMSLTESQQKDILSKAAKKLNINEDSAN